ncbi:MAG: hypothetical protein AB9835_14185 [Eubacteriales bacterium]
MSRYCKYCGSQVDEHKFCPNCGKQVGTNDVILPRTDIVINQPAPLSSLKKTKKHDKKKNTPLRRVIRIGVFVLAVLLVGAGVWVAGDLGGVWDKMNLGNVSEAWKKQSDYKDEEKAVMECLSSLADALERGDLEIALEYMDSDKKDYFRLLFTDNQSSLPNLVYALRNSKMSFLSEQDVSYDAARTATVSSELKDSTGTSKAPRMIIRLIKINDSWVVTAL